MPSPEDTNRRDFADVMEFFGGTPTGPRPVDSRPFYSGPSVPSGPYDDLIRDAAGRYGVREDVARALANAESGFNPRAVNGESSAKGLYQFIDATAAEEGIDPFDPAQAADAAMRRFRRHLDYFGGRYDLAVAAHKLGQVGVERTGGSLDPVTADYVSRILGGPRSRVPSDFDEVMAFMAGPASTPQAPEQPPAPRPEPPATAEPEPGKPLELPPMQRTGPTNLPELMAMPKGAREAFMAQRGTPVQPLPPEPTPGEKAKQAVISFVRTAPELTASVGESIGILAADIDNFAMTALRPGGPTFVNPETAGRMPRDTSFQGEVAKALKDNPNLKPEDVATYQISEKIIRPWMEKNLPNDERLRNSFLYSVLPQAVGSTLLFWGAGAATGGSRLAIAATGAMLQMPQGYREAVAAGADQETAMTAARWNALWGSSEVLGLESILSRKGLAPGIVAYVKNSLISAVDEGGQEALQQIAGNLTAKGLYDPNRGWNEGLLQSTGAGAIVGILFSGIHDAHQAIAARQAAAATPTAPGAQTVAPPGPEAVPPPIEPPGPAQTDIATANQFFAKEQLAKLVDEAERIGARIDSGVAGPNDATTMARIMQEIQRLSGEAGIATPEVRPPAPPAPVAPQPAPAPPPPAPVDTERQAAVERAGAWTPWITEGEIQSQETAEGIDRLIEVAKARREAAREKRILDRATPEERAEYARPGAPQKLILKAIEDRIAVPPPTGQPGITEEDIQAAIEAAPSAPPAPAQEVQDVPTEEAYRGAAERLRARLGGTGVAPAPAEAAPATPASQAERRAPTARGVDMTKIRPEVAAFADRYSKSGEDFLEVDKLGQLNRDEERLVADAIDRATARRPPAPGTNVFLTPEEQEYVKKFREAKGKGQPTPEPPSSGRTIKIGRGDYGGPNGKLAAATFSRLLAGELDGARITDTIDGRTGTIMPSASKETVAKKKAQGVEISVLYGIEWDNGSWSPIESPGSLSEKEITPPEPPKGKSPSGKGPSKRRETMEAKLGHWWGVILEQGAISRDSLQRTYVGEDPSKPGYAQSLKTFNEIMAGINKKWGSGLIVRTDGGMRLDEAAEMAAEKGFAGGDPIEARNKILEMLDELSGRKAPKVSGKRKGFGKIDPELASMTTDVAAGDLKEGESFTTGDGEYWTVLRKDPGEIEITNGPEGQGGKRLVLDEFDLVPIVGRPRSYAPGGGPRAMAETGPKTGDPYQDADAELKELVFTAGSYHVAKGAVTQERLVEALKKEFGPNIEQYVPGLWRLLTRLPGMQRFIKPQEVPRGPVARGDLPVQQRPGGAEAGGRVPAPGGRGPGERAGEVRQAPAAPTGSATAAAPAAAVRATPSLTVDRTQTDRGVATISRELLPPLTGIGKKMHEEYSTPERLAEMAKKFGGKRPMKHQVEQAARAVMAFSKGHAYVNSDGTGTGKTLTTGIVIDSILRDKPDARIMIVVRNPGIMRQWLADVLGPLGLKVHEVKGPFQAKKGVVNFVTYTRLQIMHTANMLGLVEGYHPDLLVFDESHALKKWYAGTTKWAQAGELISGKDYSERVLFLSATPFESILHTGYLTRTEMWGNWRKWLEDTMGIRYNADKDRWEGLTPAKVRKLHEALVSQGRMGKNEIDFAGIRNSNGQPITLTSENVLVPLTQENEQAYSSMNAVFDGFLEEALMNNDRAMLRMLRGIQHFFRRSYDEAHKLPAAIQRARQDVANGKTALFFLLRKNDSSVEKWWNRYEEEPDRYPAGSKMPLILEALRGVTPPIAVPSPVRLIQDAFPDAVKITGDETAGGAEREKNIKALMDGKAKVGIITIAAGAEALNLQDKIGTHPRVSYIVSTPYTASTAKQVMGRGFRLGSESNAEILWLFNDTPSDRKIATNMAWLSRMMGAAVSGEVENPNADELERFLFPELDKNGSNGGTAREMADWEGPDRLILESPPDPKTGEPSQKEMFKGQPENVQKEMLKQRLLAIKRKLIDTHEPIEWDDDTLFGAEEKKEAERRQAKLPGTEPKPRDMAGPAPTTLSVPGKPVKPSGRPWLWTIWEKLGVAEKERIKSRNQMLNDYLRNIGLKSFIGKMGMAGRNVRARYWPGQQYARRRIANDVGAAVHESGHFLDEVLFGLDPSGDLGSVTNAQMRQFRGELLPLATPSQGRDPLPEGLAEFVRMYITENAKAQRVAPKFYPWFEARMAADPRTDMVLTHMQTLRQEWEAFGAADWKEQFGSMFRTTYGVTGAVGRAMPFRRVHRALYWTGTMATWLEEKAARAMGVKPEQLPRQWRPSKVFGALPSRFQTVENFLEDGPYHPADPGRTSITPGLLKIADLIHDRWRDFEMYTTALHAKNLRDNLGENIEETIGIKNEWVEKAITEFGKIPEFRRAALRLEKYRVALLDYMVWGQLIDDAGKARLLKKYLDYRPLLRLMDEDLAERPSAQAGGARLAGLSTGIHRRKGSTRDIMPIFEAYQRMTFLSIDRAERNNAAMSLVRMAKQMPGGGELIHRVPMQQWPIRVSLDRVKQRLVAAGVDEKMIDDAIAEDTLTVYVPSWMQPKAPYDWVWVNGKRELYYFDPDLYRIVEGMDKIQSNIIYRFFGSFARMSRGGVAVYNPVFWVRQIFPQLVSTAVQSDNPVQYAAELPGALVEQLRQGPLAKKYQRAFTGMSTYMRLDARALSRLMGLKMLRATGEAPRWWMNPMNLARYAMAYSTKIGMAFENTTRQAEANVAGLRTAQSRSEMMRAGERARESDIDFSRQGWLTSYITGVSAFFAPYMIGQERVAREVRDHPVRLLWRLNLVLTPLAVALWAWNRRDDENEEQWKNTPRTVKDNNWIVQHPNPTKEPFQFRLPYLYGWWAAGIWAALDKMADKDPATFKALARDVVQDMNPIPRAVPNAVRSELEIWANENLWSGRPVYPEDRLPEYTYWPWTTQSAIDLGRAINVPPAILQHEIRGKLGTLGEQALRTADVVRGVERPGDVPAHATPFLGEFRGVYPRPSGEFVNRFYDVYKQAELVYRTGRMPELLMTGQTGPLFRDKAEALRIYAAGRGLATALEGFNRVLKYIEANPALSAPEKRARQEDIYRKKNEMAERWWRTTMNLAPPETGRGIIKRLLSPGGEEARP